MSKEIVGVEYKPAEITCDFDAMKKKLDDLIEPYRGSTDEALAAMDEKDIKACRRDVNAIVNSVEDGRKAVKREYMRAYDEFEAMVKELLSEPKAISEQLKRALDAKEDERKALLRQGIEASYEDYAPALVPVVPFDRIMEPKWLNKTYGPKKAVEEMYAKVDAIAKDWKSLQGMRDSMTYYDEAEAEFFRTLDLGSAINLNTRRTEEQARINALRAEVEANRAAAEPEPVPEPEPEPASETVQPDRRHYIIDIWLTDEEKAFLLDCLKSNGIGYGMHRGIKEVG